MPPTQETEVLHNMNIGDKNAASDVKCADYQAFPAASPCTHTHTHAHAHGAFLGQ